MKSLPMVKALVPFAAGIVLAEYFAVPWWLFAAAFLLCGALALLWRCWWPPGGVPVSCMRPCGRFRRGSSANGRSKWRNCPR